MHIPWDRAHRAIPAILGVIALISVGILLAWDVRPTFFAARTHALLATFSLGLIAVSYLVYQSTRRPAFAEWVKAILLAVAFLFWSANQFAANLHWATIFNDVAIALFVLDVFLVMIGWPAAGESFAETYESSDHRYAEPKSRKRV